MGRLVGWLVAVAVISHPAVAQLRGTVMDGGGRALPFATVVSLTGNGFLAVRTALDGSFAFPGRPHRPGHRLTVTAAGFQEHVYRLQPGDSVVTLTLTADRGMPPTGWTAGLLDIAEVSVVAPDGTVLRPGGDSLADGTPYILRVRFITRDRCVRFGPTDTGDMEQAHVVAQVVFLRSGRDCGGMDHTVRDIPVPVSRGSVVFRVVGQRGDVTLDFRP